MIRGLSLNPGRGGRSRLACILVVVTCALLGPPLTGGGEVAHAQPDEGSIEEADTYADTYWVLCQGMAENDQLELAMRACMRATEIYQEKLGKSDSKTREAAGKLADVAERMGKSAEAAKIREHFLGGPTPEPSSPATPSREEQMNQLFGESLAADEAGEYAKAIAGYERLLAMVAEDGKDDSKLGRGLRSKLAGVYTQQLRYGKAGPLLRKNLDQARARGDAQDLELARQGMAAHHFLAGQYDRAKPLYEENIRHAEAQDPEGFTLVFALVQLALLHNRIAQQRHSDQEFRTALGHAKRAYQLGRDLSDQPQVYGYALMMLADTYTHLGRFDDAEPLLEEALRMAETDPRVRDGLTNVLWSLGQLYRAKGEYAKAEPYWQRVLELEDEEYGSQSYKLHGVLNALAELYWAWGNKKDKLMPLAFRASELKDRKFAAVLSGGTEEMKLAFAQGYVGGTSRIVSYHLFHARQDAKAAQLAINTVMRRKGRVLDAAVDTMSELRSRAGSEDRAKLEEIQRVRAQIATLTLGGKPEKMATEQYRAKLEELNRKDQALQAGLGDASASFRAEQEPVGFEAVREEIPTNAALVEIVQYSKFNIEYRRRADALGASHYAAYVLRKGAQPKAVDLGPARTLDAQIAKFRAALSSPGRKDVKALGRTLYGRTMKRIAPLVGDAEHVLLAPDGMLNLVPFSAMVDDQGSYLVDRYQFTYLSSGRDLLSLRARSEPKSAPLIVGNPAYDTSGSGSATGDDSFRGMRSVDFSAVRFPPLPGTATEVAAIADELDDSKLVTEGEATEALLKGVNAPVLLHVATHGFFLSDLAASRSGSRGLELSSEGDEVLHVPDHESPLVRSGLALAGANKHDSSSGEDGVLTALEVTGLDLYGTQLVVLSACETGVGEVKNGDGVYGLRRALVIAGSESQVMSLWKVDDNATRDLMIDYYEALADEQGRSAALRKVQREMASSDDRSHPFFWAAFIASGRWDPMRFDWDKSEETGDSPSWDGPDFDWTFEARQFTDLRFDVVGTFIQPELFDNTFALGLNLDMTPLIGDPDDIIGFAIDMGVGLSFNGDANLGLDAHVGIGPGLWLGPFSLAPYIGLGLDNIGSAPEDGEVAEAFYMDPAFYWYAGGRMRFAIAVFGLEGYLVRTARGSITGDVAEIIPNESRLITRAVIRIDDESEISGGFHWTDYDAEVGGAVGMGGLLSYGMFLGEDW